MKLSILKYFYHNKNWNRGAVQLDVDPPHILLIKNKNEKKLNKDSVKIKLRRDPTSENSDIYELKMALFYCGKPEEFLFFVLFVRNFKMNLKASGTIAADANI